MTTTDNMNPATWHERTPGGWQNWCTVCGLLGWSTSDAAADRAMHAHLIAVHGGTR